MNWGILSLLGIIVVVLGGIGACFIVLARRSAAMSNGSGEAALVAQAEANWPVVDDPSPVTQVQPLPDRVGLKQVSTLAQHRKNCAPGHSVSSRFAVSRGRS